MTVVACKVYEDKIEIASDSQVTKGRLDITRTNSLEKIFEENGMIFGCAGHVREINLLRIFAETNVINNPTQKAVLNFVQDFAQFKQGFGLDFELNVTFIVIVKGKAFNVYCNTDIEEINTFAAIGEGEDYALTAMYLGKNVEEACKVSCELSIYCCEPIVKKVIERAS